MGYKNKEWFNHLIIRGRADWNRIQQPNQSVPGLQRGRRRRRRRTRNPGRKEKKERD